MGRGKKLVSVLLVLCMLLSTMLTIYASEYETYIKVSDELLGELDVSYEDLLLGNYEDTGAIYSCIIWIEDVQIEEAVEAGIDAAEQTRDTYSASTTYAYNYETTESDVATLVDVTLADDESDEYVQTYIEAEREAAKEMYASSNSQFVAENFMARDMSVTYVSQYTPCIFADLSVSKIAELIWESDVVWIEYEGDVETEESDADVALLGMTDADLQTALDCMRVGAAKSSLGLSGAGIKIGQIELSCPEVSTVHLNPDYDNILKLGAVDNHPERVYSIMNNIAPNATYYATGRYDGNTALANTGSFYAQIEWLLGQGVNIINESHGFTDELNTYDARACWLDHITYNHDVHFVKSAGNKGNGTEIGKNGVTSPGMAYNIITVGNCDWVKPYTIQSTSSYNFEGIGINAYRTYKPDVVAPASSTSYAAAMMTGTIALMCELQPSLKTKQPIVKSILAASAGPTTKRLVTTETDFKQYGAGMIDAWAATYVIAHGKYSQTTGVLHSSNTTQTYSMNVGADDSKMRVALSYTNYVHFGTVTDHVNTSPSINGTIADLTMYVFDPNGNLVASCPVNTSTIGANLKVIEFATGGVTGTYTIRVYMRESASGGRSTNIGVAWW